MLPDAQTVLCCHEQSLVIAQQLGLRRVEAMAVGNLGLDYQALGDAQRAADLYQRHLALAREIGDQLGIGTASFNIAETFMQLGLRDDALGHAEYALAVFESLACPHAHVVRQTLSRWRSQS